MTQAQGVGKRITGGGRGVVKPYMRVYSLVFPLPASALPPGVLPGQPDSAGQYLHFRYSANLYLGPRSGGNDTAAMAQPDAVQNALVVEFDAASSFTLPFEGQLELIGGRGEYKFWIHYAGVTHPEFYQPTYRYLTSSFKEGDVLTVPENHTYLLGSDETLKLQDIATGNVLQPPVVIPGIQVVSGQQFRVLQRTTIRTGWFG